MDPNITLLYRIIGVFCCFSENLPTRAFNYKSKLKSPIACTVLLIYLTSHYIRPHSPENDY